jgi:hypothetical protein
MDQKNAKEQYKCSKDLVWLPKKTEPLQVISTMASNRLDHRKNGWTKV